MSNIFKPKRSSTAAAVPTTGQLADGELAVNITDKKIFVRDGASVVEIANFSTGGSGTNYWAQTAVGIHTLSNVGIGTTNPLATLQVGTGVSVYGTTGIVSAASFYGSGVNLTGIVTQIVAGTNVTISPVGGTGAVTINSTASGGGGGTNYWAQTAAGIHTLSNVGVGTTNPTYKLTVANNAVSTPSLPNAIADFTSTADGYSQINVRNTSGGTSASSDIVVTADTGNDTTKYIDLGINNSNYSSGTWTVNGALDGYLYSADTNLSIGVAGATKYLSLFAGGTLLSNERVRINSTGVGIGTTNPNATLEVRPVSTSINVGLFSGSTTTDLVRITQDGVGNALRVDDQAGGTTPFIVDQFGKVGINTQTATSSLTVFGDGRLTGVTTSTYLDGSSISTLNGSILTLSYGMAMP